MSVTIICPNLKCRGVLQVPDNMRGKIVRCGKCGKNFNVPAPAQEKPVAAPEEDLSDASSSRSK